MLRTLVIAVTYYYSQARQQFGCSLRGGVMRVAHAGARPGGARRGGDVT